MGQIQEGNVTYCTGATGGPHGLTRSRTARTPLPTIARRNACPTAPVAQLSARQSRSVGAGTDREGSGGPLGDAPNHPYQPFPRVCACVCVVFRVRVRPPDGVRFAL